MSALILKLETSSTFWSKALHLQLLFSNRNRSRTIWLANHNVWIHKGKIHVPYAAHQCPCHRQFGHGRTQLKRNRVTTCEDNSFSFTQGCGWMLINACQHQRSSMLWLITWAAPLLLQVWLPIVITPDSLCQKRHVEEATRKPPFWERNVPKSWYGRRCQVLMVGWLYGHAE